jgi:hypothetical protein
VKIQSKLDGKVYDVWGTHEDMDMADYSRFLIFDNDEWKWVRITNFKPYKD